MATLAATISTSSNHDFLELAMKAAGMEAQFSGATAYTVLGPTDAAFMTMSTNIGYRGTDEAGAFDFLKEALRLFAGGSEAETKAFFAAFMQAHMLSGSRDYMNLANADAFTTLANGHFYFQQASTGEIRNTDNPTAPYIHFLLGQDMAAENGHLHALDGPLSSPVTPDLSAPNVDLRVDGNRRSVINTGLGNDFIAGRGGNDELAGGSGADVITGGSGRDEIFGGQGDDRLFGDAGVDSIFGGLGSDVIGGGAGNDVLRGGKGADTFIITKGSGRDVMPDFQADVDKIDVRDLGITRFADIEITRGRGVIFVDLGAELLVISGSSKNAPDADDFLFAAA